MTKPQLYQHQAVSVICEIPPKYTEWKKIESILMLEYIIIFVNCNLVVTRWQYTFTHKQYIEQYKINKT